MSDQVLKDTLESPKARLLLLGFEAAKNFATTKEEVMPLTVEFAKQLYRTIQEEIKKNDWI